MKQKTLTTMLVMALALLLSMSMGCGKPGDKLSIKDIPLYPNITAGDAMSQTSPGGFAGGGLAQFTTTDPFDDVFDFYADALAAYAPRQSSYTSELGRQAAFNIPKKKGIVSVAIQELTKEGTVNITFMAAGR